MVVDYEYYADSYGGYLISESSWNLYINKAIARLKRYTFGRLQEPWPKEAKNAACEMAEFLCKYEKREGKTSENNDGYSVSYDTKKTVDDTLYDIAKIYIADTGLMDLEVDG